MTANEKAKFYEGAKAFFFIAFEYGVRRMPVDNPVLENARFSHFEDRENMSFSMPQYFVERHVIIL